MSYWDASIIVYKKLDWIEKLIQQTKTQGFAYYRKKNTTLADFPVIENWLLASVEKNPFYQYHDNNYRFLPFKKFPFIVFFMVDETNQIVYIKAVFNTHQNPKKSI